MKRVTGLLTSLLLAASVVVPLASAAPARADSWSDAMAFIGPINALRASHGLGQLAIDTRLTTLANWWSGRMVGAQVLSHNGNLAGMLPAGWTLGGENVGYGGDAVSLENAFANSPEHLANMLKPQYTAIGVGVVWSGSTMWVTEDYMAGVTPIVASPPQPVAMAAMQSAGNAGYWVTTSAGGVKGFGAAVNYGSMTGHLNAPIISMSTTSDGRGYWLLAADGGIFTFGDAGYYGSTGGMHLNAPVVGISASPTGRGYRLVAADGGIFSFGNAPYYGSMGATRLNRPIIGMSTDAAGGGYRMVGTDGGVFDFKAVYYGSLGSTPPPTPITTMAATVSGQGYYLISANGTIYCFGDAHLLPGH